MGKQKDKAKAKKSSQMVLRIEKDEKAQFIKQCEAIDSSAGREIRRFMREFVALHAAGQGAIAAPEAEPEVAPDTASAAVEVVTEEVAVETVVAGDAVAKPKAVRKPRKAAVVA